MSDESGIGPNRIRTPGIDEEPVPVDAEVAGPRRAGRVPDEDLDRSLRPPTLADFVNQDQVTEQLGDLHRGRPRPRRAARPRPARRPARPGQDLARPHRRRRARRADGPDRRPGARAQGRHRRLPDRARAGQRLLHRRDPPPRARGRGDALPGDGGRRAAGRARPGRRRAHRDPAAAALHPDRRDDPHRAADDAAARPLRRLPPARALQPRAPGRRSSSAPPGILEVEIDAEGARTIAAPLARHAAGRQPAAAAGARLRRGQGPRGRSTPRSPPTRWRCSRSTPAASTAPTAPCSHRREKFGGGPVGLSTLAVAIGEEPDTIEDIFEPYLLQQGLLKRTPRGRVLTERAYEHLGLPAPERPASLF